MNYHRMCSTFFITALIAALVSPLTQAPVQAAEINNPGTYLADPAEVWVDDNYTSGGTNDGHLWGVTAFNTIQAGVDAVAAGGTIHVNPGTYVEDVQLNKSLHLVGDPGDAGPGPGPNAPTIQGCPASSPTYPYCNGISFSDTLAFSNVSVAGFIIRDHPRSIGAGDDGGFGIRIKNGGTGPMTNITINDNRFIDNRWEALMFFSVGSDAAMYFDNVKALNNQVLNTSNFTELTGSVGLECTNCRNSLVQGNVIEGRIEKGIWIASESTGANSGFQNGAGVIVDGNIVNGASLAALEIESFDTNFGSTNPILSGVTLSNNTLNRLSNGIGSQGSTLVRIRKSSSNAVIHDITVINNAMDISYAQQPAIAVVGAGQMNILNNNINAASEIPDGLGIIYLYNSDLTNTITGNQIILNNGLYTPDNGIYLAGANSGNFIISQNTLAASGISAAAIRLGASFGGSAGSTVDINSNRITGFTNNLVFENSADAHSITVQFNAMEGNSSGAVSSLGAPIAAINNWWGCNAGPNHSGCDTTTGLFNADPWLVLSLAPEISTLAPGDPISINANLLMNSAGQDKSGQGFAAPHITAAFSGTSGNFSPNPTDLLNGAAITTYTAPLAPGIVQLCTAVDGETVCRTIRVGNAFIFLPAVLR